MASMSGDQEPITSEVDYSRLREGLCPVHGTMLDRRDDNGWCEECKCGWSMTPDTINVHFDIKGGDIDGRPLGPGKAIATHHIGPSSDTPENPPQGQLNS